MDPNKIQLTPIQKIKPLIKAINEEIPWQMSLICTLALISAIVFGGMIPVFIVGSSVGDFIVRRLILGGVIGIATMFATGFCLMTLEEKIIPLVKKIGEHYEKHSLEQKKKVLEDVIDKEVLK